MTGPAAGSPAARCLRREPGRPGSRRYDLLVVDLDGTLVPEDKVVRPGVLRAIRAAQETGVRVCLATGRMWEAARAFIETMHADPPAILYNGGLVYDFTAGRALWRASLPRETARAILPVFRDFPQVTPLMFVRDRVYTERMTAQAALFARRDALTIHETPDFAGLLADDPMKFLIVGEPPDLVVLGRALAALPGPVNQVRSQVDYLEILAPDTSKGRALPVLAEAAGVPLERIVAVGDALNDLTMLRAAGLAIAVEGSPPELVEVAAWLCPRPEDEGIRVVIERVFLGGAAAGAGA